MVLDTFLIAATELLTKQLREGMVWEQSLRDGPSRREGRAWEQEAAGHVASALRKQREVKAELSSLSSRCLMLVHIPSCPLNFLFRNVMILFISLGILERVLE